MTTSASTSHSVKDANTGYGFCFAVFTSIPATILISSSFSASPEILKVEVKDNEDEIINLEDLKIEVPETYTPSRLEILIKKIKRIINKLINILKL